MTFHKNWDKKLKDLLLKEKVVLLSSRKNKKERIHAQGL